MWGETGELLENPLIAATATGDDPKGVKDGELLEFREKEWKLEADGDAPRTFASSMRRFLFESEANIEPIPVNSGYLTCFLLLNTMIGSGILNQPYVFHESGIVGGVIGFVLSAVLTWLGLLILTDSGIKLGVYDYSGCCLSILGKYGEKAVDWSIMILGCGAHIGYVLVVGDLGSSLITCWGCHSYMCTETSVIVITTVLFISPTCLMRHYGHFAWLSVFSIFSILLVLFLVLIAGPLKGENSGEIKIFDAFGTMRSLGSILFSLSCTPANFQAYLSTEKSSQNSKSWARITGAAIIIGSIMCAAMGITGYLSFKDKTEGEILDNFSQQPFDFFKVMVAMHLILYIPVNFTISRYSLVKVLYNRANAEDLNGRNHVIVTFGLLAANTAMTVLLLGTGLSSGEAFSLILDITGGVGGTLLAFILPCAMYIYSHEFNDKLYTISWVIFVLAFFLMAAVLWGIVSDQLDQNDDT